MNSHWAINSTTEVLQGQWKFSIRSRNLPPTWLHLISWDRHQNYIIKNMQMLLMNIHEKAVTIKLTHGPIWSSSSFPKDDIWWSKTNIPEINQFSIDIAWFKGSRIVNKLQYYMITKNKRDRLCTYRKPKLAEWRLSFSFAPCVIIAHEYHTVENFLNTAY